MNEKTDMKEFEKAMKPAIEWMLKNCNQHQKVIIDMNGAELVSGEMFFPAEAVGGEK